MPRVRLLALHSNHELRQGLRRLGVSPGDAARVFEAAFVHRVLVEGLKADDLAGLTGRFEQSGGTAVAGTRGRLLLVGGPASFHAFLEGLREPQHAPLKAQLEAALRHSFAAHRPPLSVGPLTLEWGKRTYLMGIINVTPDSFSGDGLLARFPGQPAERALALARRMAAQGADLVDVGGESSRPGAVPVSEEEELRRVLPVVRALAREAPEIPISVDTYRSRVAEAGLEAGAHLVNDVWAMTKDPRMARVVAGAGAPLVLMHNRSDPRSAAYSERLGGYYSRAGYADLLGEVTAALEERIRAAEEAGIPRERIILDPGLGFGKTPVQSLVLLDRLEELRALGCPILVGPSRKSFIGYVLDLPAEERLEGTAAAVAVAIVRGADLVRIHDVEAMARVARMTDALVRH